MATKIVTPQEGYTGTDAFGPLVLEFVDGVAVVEGKLSAGHREYFKRHGFKVSSVKSENQAQATADAEKQAEPDTTEQEDAQ